MARTARLLCFLLTSVLILVNVETKSRKSVNHPSTTSHKGHTIDRRTSFPVSQHPRPTSKPHTYPGSPGGSGSGSHVTNSPRVTYQPYQQPKTTLGTHSYPPSNGGSGGGGSVTTAPSPGYTPYPHPKPMAGVHSYPPSNGGSGGGRSVTTAPYPLPGYTPYPHPKPMAGVHSYPPSNGGSGGGRSVTTAPYPLPGYTPYPHPKPTAGTHSYPPSRGGSGGGFKPNPGTGVYPHNTGISSTINLNGHTGHSGYNSHVYVRNQQTTNIYTSNMRTTNIHYYHYNPPQQFHYSSYGSQPVYTGRLPDYVFEYRASRSRYSKLLAGLALYNLGLVSKKHEVQAYHNHYQPRTDEICQFGIDYNYNVLRTEVMEVDCRLMTEFIWSESQMSPPNVVVGNQIYLPNGTLISSYQVGTTGVLNALDPRFNGDYVHLQPGMKCYIKWTVSWTHPRTREVDCGLLQAYVDRSLNSATKVTSGLLILSMVTSVTVYLFY